MVRRLSPDRGERRITAAGVVLDTPAVNGGILIMKSATSFPLQPLAVVRNGLYLIELDNYTTGRLYWTRIEPEPKPVPKSRKKRAARPVRAKKAATAADADYELDINQPFAAGELELSEAELDVESEEEPIRRARGSGRKGNRPLTKGRRTRKTTQ